MNRSRMGGKMCSMSGLRVIVDDVAALTGRPGGELPNLGIGNPALIPEASAF